MSHLPDRRRASFQPTARALAAPLADAALAASWRVLHPELRQRFLEARRPAPARRVHYTTSDGWQAPLFALPPCPGAPGEPVLLAHALGLAGDAYRYGARPIARALCQAGFSVYLLTHRGDRDAVAPGEAARGDFDDIVARDLPAALDAVRADSGYPRALWVGHGFGGQLGLAHAGRTGGEGLAALVLVNAAVRFCPPASEVRRVLAAARWLPRGWALPGRLAGLLAPLVDDHGPALERFAGGRTPGPRVRGLLRFGAEDVPVGLLRQVEAWMRAGRLVDRSGTLDYAEACATARAPLMLVTAAGDDLCRPAQARALLETWGGEDVATLDLDEGWGHDDPLFAEAAPELVHAPIAAWLDARRRLAWGQREAANVTVGRPLEEVARFPGTRS